VFQTKFFFLFSFVLGSPDCYFESDKCGWQGSDEWMIHYLSSWMNHKGEQTPDHSQSKSLIVYQASTIQTIAQQQQLNNSDTRNNENKNSNDNKNNNSNTH
jgi:hypothetical protein